MNPRTVTPPKAYRRGTLYRLVSNATVWYLSTCPGWMTQASNGRAGRGPAAARSCSRRAATVWVAVPAVRSRAWRQHRRRWSFNPARSGTRGTGVAHIRSRSLTRFSTRGFSWGVAGMQTQGAKA